VVALAHRAPGTVPVRFRALSFARLVSTMRQPSPHDQLRKKLPDYKPVSVPLRATIIRLGRTSLSGSSSLPGSSLGRAVPPPLFGLAPRGVCPAGEIAPAAVRSYRTISPLPVPILKHRSRRYIFCGTFRIRYRTPAVSRHAALWRPDFPPPFPGAIAHPAASVLLSHPLRPDLYLETLCQID